MPERPSLRVVTVDTKIVSEPKMVVGFSLLGVGGSRTDKQDGVDWIENGGVLTAVGGVLLALVLVRCPGPWLRSAAGRSLGSPGSQSGGGLRDLFVKDK